MVGERSVFLHTGGVDLDRRNGVVLLVHGAGNDHTIWRFVTRRLAAAGWPVVAVDLPGHGKTDGPALGSIQAMADWCFDVVDSLGADEVTIVGHSMGSLIAMEMACRQPGRIRGIALFSPATHMAVHPELQEAADRRDNLATDLIVGWSHSGRSRFGHHTAPGLWMAGANRRLLERNIGSLGADLVACSEWDGSAAFGQVHAPTLVIVGEKDVMVPARAGRELAAELPHAELVEIPGGAHASLYDHPDEVVGPLIGWLASNRTRPEWRD